MQLLFPQQHCNILQCITPRSLHQLHLATKTPFNSHLPTSTRLPPCTFPNNLPIRNLSLMRNNNRNHLILRDTLPIPIPLLQADMEVRPSRHTTIIAKRTASRMMTRWKEISLKYGERRIASSKGICDVGSPYSPFRFRFLLLSIPSHANISQYAVQTTLPTLSGTWPTSNLTTPLYKMHSQCHSNMKVIFKDGYMISKVSYSATDWLVMSKA